MDDSKIISFILDPDKNGVADPEHVSLVMDSVFSKERSPLSISALMKTYNHEGNPFGKTLLSEKFVNSIKEGISANGKQALEEMLGLRVPPASMQIISDRIMSNFNGIVTANNKVFLDRGDPNNGNAGKGDGVLATGEIMPAMEELQKQNIKLTAEELAKTIEKAGLKASPELVKAAIGYQKYLEEKSRSSAKTPETTDSPLPPDTTIRGGEHVPDGANLNPGNQLGKDKPGGALIR